MAVCGGRWRSSGRLVTMPNAVSLLLLLMTKLEPVPSGRHFEGLIRCVSCISSKLVPHRLTVADHAMGFCFYNNIALSALVALRKGAQRVLIFDWVREHKAKLVGPPALVGHRSICFRCWLLKAACHVVLVCGGLALIVSALRRHRPLRRTCPTGRAPRQWH